MPFLRLALAALLATGLCGTAQASVYCVERDADAVLGVQLHDGISRCVPAP